MTDQELNDLSKEVDNFIADFILDNKISIDVFNGVMMARMMILNSEVKNIEGFLQLLEVMKEEQYHRPPEISLQ
jgi:hypothetical protein